jgi:hypothetical protein
MNNTYKLLALPCALGMGLITSPVFADEARKGTFFGKEAAGKWIVGVKAAKVENDGAVREINTDDSEATGLVLGYEFARPVGDSGSSSVELEILSIDDADVDNGSLGEWNGDIVNLFFTYRSPGTVYWKGKIGLSYTSLDYTLPLISEQNDTSLALGLGLGYRIEDYGVVELEYSKDSGDNDIGLFGLNAMINF